MVMSENSSVLYSLDMSAGQCKFERLRAVPCSIETTDPERSAHFPFLRRNVAMSKAWRCVACEQKFCKVKHREVAVWDAGVHMR
jgi:hypothetical protein